MHRGEFTAVIGPQTPVVSFDYVRHADRPYLLFRYVGGGPLHRRRPPGPSPIVGSNHLQGGVADLQSHACIARATVDRLETLGIVDVLMGSGVADHSSNVSGVYYISRRHGRPRRNRLIQACVRRSLPRHPYVLMLPLTDTV